MSAILDMIKRLLKYLYGNFNGVNFIHVRAIFERFVLNQSSKVTDILSSD